MIEFTIKTLDSNDHYFCVDDEITVEQLKEKVLEQLGVEIHLQRLIFCGRVLQDSKKLADYGVHGKVIHMVQRAPPTLEEREAALREQEQELNFPMPPPGIGSEAPNLGPIHLNHISQQQIRRLIALAATAQGIEIEETPAHDLSPTASRLEFLRRLIIEIRTNLDDLSDNESEEPRTYPTDDPLEADSRPHTFPQEIDRGFGASREGRGRRIRSMRPNYHTHPRDFGLLVEELHELHDEFSIFRELYISTLREASDSDVSISEEMLQRRQRTSDLCAELYHAFSHAYHILSDVGLMLAHNNSRLTSEALMRHPLPAQINVMPPSPPPPAATNDAPSQPPLEGQDGSLALAGTSTTPPTVNINIRPDPVTYQFELETTVPIPVAVENPETSSNHTRHVYQNSDQSSQSVHNDAEQPAQDGPSDRRHIMMEFENLFRGLGQAGRLRDVEVVMSVEEIPQVSGGANNPTTATSSQPIENEAYIAQTANLLHEIVMSVFRQGVIPGVDELFQVQQMDGQSQQNSTQDQPQPQDQPQMSQDEQFHPLHVSQIRAQSEPTQHQQEINTQGQNISQSPRQIQSPDRSQEFQINNEQGQHHNTPNVSQNLGNLPLPTIRTQTVSIFDLVYDRFLQCDSQHARRQLQLRRDESVQLGGPRLRDTASTRIQNNVETLYERFNSFSFDEESLLIAATVLLREATSFSSGRTLIPNELSPLRHRMQVYMRRLMQGEYEDGTQEQLADLIFQRHSGFLSRISMITPIRPNVDVMASVRAVFVRFLNEAMNVLDIPAIEIFSRRFRIIYPRMFYELCGVLSYCSLDGPAGLTMIYRSFIIDLTQHIDEPVRDLLYSLSIENLNTALARVTANKIHYPQFIRRTFQPSCSVSSNGEASTSGGSQSAGPSSSGLAPMDVESPTVRKSDGNESQRTGNESSGVENQSNVSGDQSNISGDQSIESANQSNVSGDQSNISGDQSIESANQSNVSGDQSNISGDQSIESANQSNVSGDQSNISGDQSIESADQSNVSGDQTTDSGNRSDYNPDDTLTMDFTSSLDETLVLTQISLTDEIMDTSVEFNITGITTSSPEKPHTTHTSDYIQTSGPSEIQEKMSEEANSADIIDVDKDDQPTAKNCGGFRISTVDDDLKLLEPMVMDSTTGDDTELKIRDNFRDGLLDDSDLLQEIDDNLENFPAMATSSPIQAAVVVENPSMNQDDVSKPREEAGSALNVTENVSDNGNLLPLDVSKHFGRFRISLVDELARWSEPASNRVDTDFDSRRCTPFFNNLLKFRRDLLRYPGPLEKARALLEGSPHRSTPSPPLETVIVDLPSGRRNYVGGILRREMPHLIVSPLAAEPAGASSQTPRAVETPRGPDHSDAHASNTPNQSRCRSRRPRSKSPESPDSESFVPPAQIAQYWGDQWVPTFTRDQQQQFDSDEPYSDAYLSGMPPKKRRCVRQARPPQEPNALVRESLQDISLRQGVPPTISTAFRDQLRRYLSTHSLASQNYDPRRYTSAARFLTQTRKTKKASEKTKQ